jgi:hypothetical protein
MQQQQAPQKKEKARVANHMTSTEEDPAAPASKASSIVL